MCRMAVFMPSEGRNLEQLKSSFDTLSKRGGGHGVGVAIFEPSGKLTITKAEKLGEGASADLIANRPAGSVAFWHTRMRSAGATGDVGCHPFWVSSSALPDKNEVVLMHNGTISNWEPMSRLLGAANSVSDSNFLAYVVAIRGPKLASELIGHGALVFAQRFFVGGVPQPWKFYAYRAMSGDLLAMPGGGLVSSTCALDAGRDIKGNMWHRLDGKEVPQYTPPVYTQQRELSEYWASRGWYDHKDDNPRAQRVIPIHTVPASVGLATNKAPPAFDSLPHFSLLCANNKPGGSSYSELVVSHGPVNKVGMSELVIRHSDGILSILDTPRRISKIKKLLCKKTPLERSTFLASLASSKTPTHTPVKE